MPSRLSAASRAPLELVVLWSLFGAAACAQVAPAAEPLEARITAPTASAPEPRPSEEPPRPRTDRELAEVQAMLRNADAKLASGDAASARKLYEDAWALMRPNPLALTMAAYAASASGDASGAHSLLTRAQTEAKAQNGSCASQGYRTGSFESRDYSLEPTGDYWRKDEDVWLRSTPAGHVRLGFCGAASPDPMLAPEAAVAWAPPGFEVSYVQPAPNQDGSATPGREVLVRDDVYGRELGRAPVSFSHWDFNEGYSGSIGIQPVYSDRALFAVAGMEVVRVFRQRDREVLYDLPFPNAHEVGFSPDGQLLYAIDCQRIALYRADTGTLVSYVRPPHVNCVYGGGLSDPIGVPVFTPNNELLAVPYTVAGPPLYPPPPNEEGSFVGIYKVSDGKRVRRLQGDYMLTRLTDFTGDKLYSCSHPPLDAKTGKASSVSEPAGAPYSCPYALHPDRRFVTTDQGVKELRETSPSRLARFGAYLLPESVDALGGAAH